MQHRRMLTRGKACQIGSIRRAYLDQYLRCWSFKRWRRGLEVRLKSLKSYAKTACAACVCPSQTTSVDGVHLNWNASAHLRCWRCQRWHQAPLGTPGSCAQTAYAPWQPTIWCSLLCLETALAIQQHLQQEQEHTPSQLDQSSCEISLPLSLSFA